MLLYRVIDAVSETHLHFHLQVRNKQQRSDANTEVGQWRDPAP